MNAIPLATAALLATVIPALACIEEGYDPLELGHRDKAPPGMRDPIEMPGGTERHGARGWLNAAVKSVEQARQDVAAVPPSGRDRLA